VSFKHDRGNSSLPGLYSESSRTQWCGQALSGHILRSSRIEIHIFLTMTYNPVLQVELATMLPEQLPACCNLLHRLLCSS